MASTSFIFNHLLLSVSTWKILLHIFHILCQFSLFNSYSADKPKQWYFSVWCYVSMWQFIVCFSVLSALCSCFLVSKFLKGLPLLSLVSLLVCFHCLNYLDIEHNSCFILHIEHPWLDAGICKYCLIKPLGLVVHSYYTVLFVLCGGLLSPFETPFESLSAWPWSLVRLTFLWGHNSFSSLF